MQLHYMKVTKVLIEKYHLGACNNQERELIEEWLQGHIPEALPIFLPYKAEDRIWNKLKRSTIHKTAITNWLIGLIACIFILWIITYLPHE